MFLKTLLPPTLKKVCTTFEPARNKVREPED